MVDREAHLGHLFTAELQFRLASATRIAVQTQQQPLDLPIEWTHGQHRVHYEEVALRQDQAHFAADHLQQSATYLLAVTMKDAIRAAVSDPKNSQVPGVRAAYQISRLVRNAFAHAPFSPVWSIDPDCQGQVFEVPGVVTLDTTNIHGTPLQWQQYGGPLAMFRLCRFVRHEVLKEPSVPRKIVPLPKEHYQQVGDLILQKVSGVPDGAVPIERLPDGRIPLGGGYFIDPKKVE